VLIAIGYLVVISTVFGGYLLSGGSLGPIWQPLEILMIAGAAIGAFIAGNNIKAMKAVGRSIKSLKITTGYNKETYVQLMVMLYTLLTKSKREGMKAIERDIENPQDSEIFKRYPKVLNDETLVVFISDYMRMMVTGNMNPHELDELMVHEIEELEHELQLASDALNKMADGMPAFGIVAAVMGVVKALTYADATAAELGEMVAHALVGTFIGILLAYGFVAPVATKIDRQIAERLKILQCVRVTLLSSLNGYQPQLACEFGRKTLHSVERPSSIELEELIRESKKSGSQA
jgi:chemotaxis protein MotA